MEINEDKLLCCPFCGEKPTLTKEIKYKSFWDGKYLKFPVVRINIKCDKEYCVKPDLLETMSYRKVNKKDGETSVQMNEKIENEVISKAIEKWNKRF